MTAAGPLALWILDGWGLRSSREHNAIALARTPHYSELLARFPHTELAASGERVGLPAGQMGNSEVGHMNMGAGRVVYQDLTRIDKAIADGELFSIPALIAAMDRCSSGARALHLIGLLSDGGVHSHQRHLHALIQRRHNDGGRGCSSKFHRRPRHLANGGNPLRPGTAGSDSTHGHREARIALRPLPRDGPG